MNIFIRIKLNVIRQVKDLNDYEKNQQKIHYLSEDTRSSTRQRKSTSSGLDFLALLLENEPQTFKATISSSESTY